MSYTSNHEPEVIEELNGQLENEAELDAMAEYFARESSPTPAPTPKLVVPAEALAEYETSMLTFWGFVDAVRQDLKTTTDIGWVRHLAHCLEEKLEEVQHHHRQWERRKWSA